MSDAPKPAPCPWCGAETKAVLWGAHPARWAVECQGKGCMTSGPTTFTKSAAIAAWNRVAEKRDE